MSTIYPIATFLATAAALLLLRPVALRIGLLDFPGGRKTHIAATPLIGGIGIFVGLVLISFFLPPILAEFGSLLSLSALILFIGTIDDIKDLKPYVRMTGHALVALSMAVVAGIQLQSFGDIVYLGAIDTGWLAIPITVFATVGVINALNMSDGIDGLSGGIAIISFGSIAILALAGGAFGAVNFIVLIICSILAFLTMNFRRPWNRRALVYLGDAGSTMLGFMLAWLLIDSAQGSERLFAPVHALWFLAIPLFDTVNLLIKRPMRGISPFQPGTDHLHHNLLARGYSVTQVVIIILSVSACFAAFGLIGYFWEFEESFMFQAFISIFVLYFFVAEKVSGQSSRLNH